LLICPAAPTDAKAIRALLCVELLETDPTSPDDAKIDILRIDAALARTDADILWLVANQGGLVVGTCMVALSHLADDIWEIGNLAVTSTRRRQGLGAALVAACEQYAAGRGGGTIMLATAEPKFYQRLDYREIRGTGGLMVKQLRA